MTGEVAGKKTPKDDERENGRNQQAGCFSRFYSGGQNPPIWLTDWLSGSGGTGETHIILAPFLANRACARAAEPLSAGAGVGRV